MSPGQRVEWIDIIVEVSPRAPSGLDPGYIGTVAHLAGHGVTLQEVQELCCWGNPSATAWRDDPGRGPTLIVRGATSAGRRLVCFLKLDVPVADRSGLAAYTVKTAYEEK
jgi:hypothetical protein